MRLSIFLLVIFAFIVSSCFFTSVNAQEQQQQQQQQEQKKEEVAKQEPVKTLAKLVLTKEQAVVSVKTSSNATPVLLKASYPSAVTLSAQQKGIKCERGGSIDISFVTAAAEANGQTNAIAPQQSIVKFTNKATGNEADFVTKVNRATGKHEITINPSLSGEVFKYESGLYSIDILVADSSVENPTIWKLVDGIDIITSSEPAKKRLPLYYEPLLHESDVSTAPLPEIHHIFRAPDKRPPQIVSYAFALAIVGLLVILPVILFLAGGNIKGLSLNPLPFVYLGTVGSIFALYAYYWYALNMFQLLGYLTPLFIGLLVVDKLGGLSVLNQKSIDTHQKTE